MKLFYINSEKIPFKNDLKDFILNLSPVSFQKHGGDGKSTDFSIMFDTLLKSCADDKVVIFISDCVLAPKQGGNAEVFLDLHKHALKKTFNDHLSDHKDFKTIVLKLNSEFSGTYYDFKVGTHQLKKGNRPYYMWILGNKQHVDQLIAKIGVPKDAENYLVFSCAEKSPTHKVLFTQKIGEYTKGDSNNTLIKASKAEVGKNAGYFGFPVGIDLTEYVFDSSHLLSPESYKVMPPSYSVTVEPVTDDEKDNKPYLKNFSHCLVLRTTDLQEEEISIQLKRALPGWVSQSNSEDDTRQAGGEQHKTYGILHMLTGIAEAYESAAKDKEAYFKLTFAIEK